MTLVQLPPSYQQAIPVLEQFLQETASSTLRVAGGRQRRPLPPRNLQITVGTLDVTITWSAPPKAGAANIVGWRVYKDNESNLVDRISDAATLQSKIKLSLASATGFYVSSVNAIGQESIKVQIIGTPTAISTDNIIDGTGSPIAGGKRGFQALDVNNRLANSQRLTAVNAASILTTGPLSYDGVTQQINVAASVLKIGGGVSVNYNSGTVSIPVGSGSYYVYADDPTYAGGAVTYLKTTNKYDLNGAEGRVFFGFISVVPGNPSTGTGGGQGGARTNS